MASYTSVQRALSRNAEEEGEEEEEEEEEEAES
jgi:hypothetical protein